MTNNFLLAFQITALGMGLVFAAIILLWLMMVVLTAITADKDASDSADANSLTPDLSPTGRGETLAQAAAIAVAMALAEQQESNAHSLSTPPTALVSAWQLGMRTRQLYQKGIPIKRQPRNIGR